MTSWSQGLPRFQNIKITLNVTDNARKKAEKYYVTKKFNKQLEFLETNPRHNSLVFKPIPEFGKKIWRFRVNDHYWGLVIKETNRKNTLRVYDVVKHP